MKTVIAYVFFLTALGVCPARSPGATPSQAVESQAQQAVRYEEMNVWEAFSMPKNESREVSICAYYAHVPDGMSPIIFGCKEHADLGLHAYGILLNPVPGKSVVIKKDKWGIFTGRLLWKIGPLQDGKPIYCRLELEVCEYLEWHKPSLEDYAGNKKPAAPHKTGSE